MTKNDFEKDKYQEEYKIFSNDLWDFVSNVLLKQKFEKSLLFSRGNGASAAIASHVATDINKALGCIARTFHDPALMTCSQTITGLKIGWPKPSSIFLTKTISLYDPSVADL